MKTLICLFTLAFTLNTYAISREEFENLGEKVLELYTKEFQKLNLDVFNVPEWENEIANAMMFTRNYPYYELQYFGGLLTKGLNLDSLAIVLCHEVGHVLGKKLSNEPFETAPEGEADYFATSDCARKLWSKYPKLKSTFKLSNQEVKDLRNLKLKDKMTERIVLASFHLLKNLVHSSVKLSDTDEVIVDETLLDYPSPACRLKTYIAGASGKARPKCWYKNF